MANSKTAKLKERTEKVLAQVKKSDAVAKQETILEALQKAESVVAKADTSVAARKEIDVSKANLRHVISEKARLQETVGTLIAGYDALTNALGGQIDSMKDMTTWESLVGFFSSKSARDMREARIQGASIDAQLQDLMAQTQSINRLLSEHLQVLSHEYTSVKAMLDTQLAKQKEATEAFEAADKELEVLNREVEAKRDALTELTGADRVGAEEELQTLLNRANDLTEQRNTLLSNAQTHELFAENHRIALDSLMRQKAAQRVLIDKLRISTENRIVQYSATVESLRTAAQQESAHVVNEIGVHVDQETSKTMAAIGVAADRQIIEMLERHATDLGKRRATQSEIARADAEFTRRFAEVAQKFIQDAYGDEE